MSRAIEIKNLSFTYPKQSIPALENIDLQIDEGEFVLLIGQSGSGKSTLNLLLKPELAPKGTQSGEIFIFSHDVKSISSRQSAKTIGIVQQDVEYQLVTHIVRSELAFALENIGLSHNEIAIRIAETVEYFSLENVLDSRIHTLSGGMKQIVCLASVCILHPKIIILDEPSSQLDPIAADRLFRILKKLNEDLGITIIICEHRLQQLVPLANRIVALNDGKLVLNTQPDKITKQMAMEDEFLYASLPCFMKVCMELNISPVPLTISEAKKHIAENLKFIDNVNITSSKRELSCEKAISISKLYYSYEGTKYVINNLNLDVFSGEIFALMGANGSGKTTLLKLISSQLKSKKGKIKLFGKSVQALGSEIFDYVSVLPQRVEAMFAGPEVFDDLYKCAKNHFSSKLEAEEKVRGICKELNISDIIHHHPYDISGGQMQRAALAMLLLGNPKLLLLDEPTQGLDALCKQNLISIIKKLSQSGVTVIMICHDADFIAETADECAMMFDGKIIYRCFSDEFFLSNYYYTTSPRRLSLDIADGVVFENQLMSLCKKGQK